MHADAPLDVAIVDYGLGNLYSVKHACAHAGLRAEVTSAPSAIIGAAAAILPGVGAFGDAMATLRRRDLVEPLRDVVASGKPFVGICLGLQLLMTESEEFGAHKGLGIIEGGVARFAAPRLNDRLLKVPQIGWNGIYRFPRPASRSGDPWAATILDGVTEGEPMYFVHSYYVQPADPAVMLSTSAYGDVEFCSAIQVGNITACQFHPERSGPVGLGIYKNLATRIRGTSLQRSSASVV